MGPRTGTCWSKSRRAIRFFTISTPTGGQNLFVSTEGKGNPNIADQVKLHETFEFKKVDLDRAAVEREAVSTTKISFSGN